MVTTLNVFLTRRGDYEGKGQRYGPEVQTKGRAQKAGHGGPPGEITPERSVLSGCVTRYDGRPGRR